MVGGVGERGAKVLSAFLGAALIVVLALPFLLRPRARGVTAAGSGAGRVAQKLIIVSPHWEGIRTEFERAFSEWTSRNLGHATDVDWLDVGGTSDILRYVRSEFARSPKGIGIDLLFGGGVDPYLALIKDGLLEPCELPPQVLELPAVQPPAWAAAADSPERLLFTGA